MKLFKKSILAAVALFGIALTACQDEENYVPGAQSDGVYFANTAARINLSREATSFDVVVGRTGSTAAATYGIIAEYDEYTFTVPESVTFAENQTTATITIGYDLEMLEVGYANLFKISFAEGTPLMAYGQTSLEFNAVLSVNWSSYKKFGEGTGTYMYEYDMQGGFFVTMFGFPSSESLTIDECYDQDNPTIYQHRIANWGNGVELLIERDSETNICMVQPQEVGIALDLAAGYYALPETDETTGKYIYDENGKLVFPAGYASCYVVDAYSFYGDPDLASASFYDPETGTFYLYVMYLCYSQGEDADPSVFAMGYEIFQVDGYDYNTSVDFAGTFINAEGSKTNAVFNVTVGSEATEGHFAMAEGSDYEALLSAIVNGTVETVNLKPGEHRVEMPIKNTGTHVGVCVTYKGSEPMMFGYDTFTFNGGGTDFEAWESVGSGMMIDGWFIPMVPLGQDSNGDGEITSDELIPFSEIAWDIEVERSLKRPGVYRAVNPYAAEYCPLAYIPGVNLDDGMGYIEFDASDPNCVVVLPQYAGYTYYGDETPYYLSNIAGVWISSEQVSDKSQIIETGLNDTLGEDGVVAINSPMFSDVPDDPKKWYYHPDAENQEEFGTYTLIYVQALDQTLEPEQVIAKNRAFGLAKAGLKTNLTKKTFNLAPQLKKNPVIKPLTTIEFKTRPRL